MAAYRCMLHVEPIFIQQFSPRFEGIKTNVRFVHGTGCSVIKTSHKKLQPLMNRECIW